MLVALGLYGCAAVCDARWRRVPNVLWLAGCLALLWRGAPLTAVYAALVVGAVAVLSWHVGEIGGADVKALALLPIALPASWPVAVLATAVLVGIAFVGFGRDEVPMLVPVFAGVVVAGPVLGFIA